MVEFTIGNMFGLRFGYVRTFYIIPNIQHSLKASLLRQSINRLTAGERDVRSWTKLILTGFILHKQQLHNVGTL
jgi:hypothetical protein